MFTRHIKKYSFFIFSDWSKQERDKFLELATPRKNAVIVDLGCGDGTFTKELAQKVHAKIVFGVDSESMRKTLNKKRIKFISANLNKKLPFKDNTFDIVFSHFSVEHLYNTGLFLREVRRVLKKNGYALIATDNLSDWPNIIALLLGWQPFITSYGVANKVLGNPLSLGDATGFSIEDESELGELSHNKVLAYSMFKDSLKEFGFRIHKFVGIGYLPFFGSFVRFFANNDIRHSQFLIAKISKK